MRYVCSICGYVYDEEVEGVPFADLPDSWVCPLCGAAKSAFAPETAAPAEQPAAPDAAPAAPAELDEGMLELPPLVLSAICSNLARGCENQYRDEERALFQQLADYFAARSPEEPAGDGAALAGLFADDLARGYPELSAAARAAGDRGTQRICVWGEKVTRALESVLSRYAREGDALLEGKSVWVCSVCGFTFIGERPPERCPVCKVPAWKFDKIEGRCAA